MRPFILLVSSALAVSATRHGHTHFQRHQHAPLARGVDEALDAFKNKTSEAADKISNTIDTLLARVESWTIPSTCPWKIPWPLPNTPQPTIDNTPTPQLTLFKRPHSSPSTLTIYNFCPYPLHYEPHIGNTIEPRGLLQAGASLNRSFDSTPRAAGVNLKVSKSADDFSKPVQIEYAVSEGTVWYDISLIDCLGRNEEGLRNGDTSACAGHEAGLQMGPGEEGAVSFQCAAGAWCDDQVYLYEENLCKKSNPNSACAADKGMAVEFCASKRE